MQTIVQVRLQQVGKLFPYAPGQLTLQPGDKVIVDTPRGTECGTVMTPPREAELTEDTPVLRVVRRKANEQDMERLAENKKREQEAFTICGQKIQQHGLAMKLVKVEYTFDRNKIIFYFTADGRIDFRQLVKDLASVFHTRIELRQIGVRDEAKIMGGIGCCGRPLCCASFLGDFQPVSIRMAKEQNLSLNPTKISGICGRLMCCLKYENECYCAGECFERRKPQVEAPHPGSRVATIDGDGKVIAVHEQRRTATILLDNSRTIVAAWEDVVEKEDDEPSSTSAATATSGAHAGEAERQEHRPRRPRRPRRTEGQDGRESREGERSHRQRRPRRDLHSRDGAPRHERRNSRRDRRPRGDNKRHNDHAGHNNGPQEPQG